MQGLTRSDPRRYVLSILNAALGGGSSSRLFQEVRERRGLAYSVYSFGLGYSDAGMVGVAAGSLPSKSEDLLRVVRHELAKVAAGGLTEEEVERGRGQARGGTVLSLEDSGSRMTRLGEAELFQRRLRPVDEVLERIAAVTVQDVGALAAELFTRPETLAVVGPA
jgi:predicted Zn-dependent peptidase